MKKGFLGQIPAFLLEIKKSPDSFCLFFRHKKTNSYFKKSTVNLC